MKVVSWLIVGACLAAIFGALFGKDDTDPPDGRSGLRLMTDARTGCQYLAMPLGGITPRRDGEGKHVGCRS